MIIRKFEKILTIFAMISAPIYGMHSETPKMKRSQSAGPLERRDQNMLFSQKSKDNEGVLTSRNSVDEFLSDDGDEFESINRSSNPFNSTISSQSQGSDSEASLNPAPVNREPTNEILLFGPRPAMTSEQKAEIDRLYQRLVREYLPNIIRGKAPGDSTDTESRGTVL